jgi:hypothetical protein
MVVRDQRYNESMNGEILILTKKQCSQKAGGKKGKTLCFHTETKGFKCC